MLIYGAPGYKTLPALKKQKIVQMIKGMEWLLKEGPETIGTKKAQDAFLEYYSFQDAKFIKELYDELYA